MSQMKASEQLEKIGTCDRNAIIAQTMLTVPDPKDFSDFTRILRNITPENRGLDRDQPHLQTCKWILSDPVFTQWKDSESGGLLFITGSPGCGKSNLAKYIQGVMAKPKNDDGEENMVLSFYCDSLESSRANPPILDLIVKSLLGKPRTISRQSRQKLLSLLENLVPDRKTHSLLEVDTEVRFNHLMEVAQTLVCDKNGPPACLIIDGLDQCEDEFILRLLRGLDTIFRRDSTTSTLKVVITSRMADSIRGFAFANEHIEITPEMIGDDIQNVVNEEVDRVILSRQIATVGRDSVSAVIVERANGSFLFASSVLKELWLIKDTGANSVFTLVTSCPSTMEAIYQQDMNRLESERPDLFELVQILCIAKRALQVSEAREILRVRNADITNNYDLKGDLTRMCQRLVKIGSEDNLELLHQTLYDFIINTYDVSLIHERLAEACLDYLAKLNDSDWEVALAYQSRRRKSRRRDPFPFLIYASPWMGYHWRHAGEHSKEKAWDLWDFICSEHGLKWQRYNLPRVSYLATEADPQNFRSQTSLSSSAIRRPDDSGSGSDSEPASESDEEGAVVVRPFSPPRDDEDDSDSGSTASSSSTSSEPANTLPAADTSAKTPLIILAQWDADVIIRELFFEAIESSPRQLFHTVLSMVPYTSRKTPGTSRKDFKRMINEVWEGTTAVHYAAAQSGRALEVLLPFVDDLDLPDEDGATPLILAAASGEIKGVNLLLDAGADIDHVDNWHQTALYSALHANSPEVVRALLEHGADPNIAADSGHSPLEVVIGKNHLEYAQILLEFSPDVTAPMTTGQPPAFLANRLESREVLEVLLPHIDVDQAWDGERIIHNSTWRGWESVVKKLIKLGANIDDPPTETPKASPVALAAECGHNSILKALLAAGASPNCPTPNMSSPLHIAASQGNLEACKQLLRAGCDIDAESEVQRTALYIAADRVQPEIVDLLIHHRADPNKPKYEPPLQVAADVGNFEILRSLLYGCKGLDIDAKGETDETALGIAAGYGDLNMVNTLLDHGADPNLRSGRRTSNTPLQLASGNRHRETIIALLNRGADPYPEHPKEQSAFHTASWDGFIDVMETFIDVADDPHELVNFEWGWYGTPLLQAAISGKLEAVQLLLKKGADPEYTLKSKINHNKTILHAAAEGGNVEVFEAILAVIKEPNLEVRDFKGRTPIYYACVEGREKMVDYLLDKGAQTDIILATGENLTAGITDGGSAKILRSVLEKNPEMDVDIPRNTDGRTPIFFAVTHGRAEITSILLSHGADANRRCREEEFPLVAAIQYREKAALKVLLEHEATDLTQKDIFGRNALQIAQNGGSRAMPGMILAATKNPNLETELMEHPDMYGKNALDLVRFDIKQQVPWADSMAAIRKEAEGLLTSFVPRGPQWERLGKFLLQVSAYSFAEVAFMRSIEAVETTPLFLEYQLPCRLCLELIPFTRYTCIECCDTDLCQRCIGRYPQLGYQMWTCYYHSFFQIKAPGSKESKKPWPRRNSDESFCRVELLPAITEESEEEEEEGKDQKLLARSEVAVLDEDEVASQAGSDGHVLVPSVNALSRSTSGSQIDFKDDTDTEPSGEKAEDQDGGEQGKQLVRVEPTEYVEPTEAQLRQFLDTIIQLFAVGQTEERLVKWDWSSEKWKAEFDRRVVAKPDAKVRHPDILLPYPPGNENNEQVEAYEYLSGLAYLSPAVPYCLSLTGLTWDGYQRVGAKKKRNLQRLARKVIQPDRPFREMGPEID